jgi:HAD superfamily hydrolase (TIGR01459 family)
MAGPTFIAGLEEIAGSYDGLIVDQWGVLHDGSTVYPEALHCLEQLRAADKRIVLLSNSGRRLGVNRRRLGSLGFPPWLQESVITSGEVAWQSLAARTEPFFAALGRRCLLWPEANDRSILDGLDLVPVERAEDADFILLSGVTLGLDPDSIEPELRAGADRGLPMVCCNPDRIVVTGAGIILAPGTVAARYEAQGGRVHYIGKPHPAVYRLCLERLAPLPPERILAVGDSMEHDIGGGARAGLDTALIMAGIHSPNFDLGRQPGDHLPALRRLADEHGVMPRWVLARFRWQRG